MQILNFFNEYSGALTVLVTAAYVIATIFIWKANYNSAKASKAQLEESKRQYEDTKRLSMKPYLQAENYDGLTNHQLTLSLVSNDADGGQYILKINIKNIGNGTAKNICYKWNNFAKSYNRGDFPIRALKSGDAQSVKIIFSCPKAFADVTFASLDLTYEDLLENSYVQRLQFGFENKNGTFRLINYLMAPPCSIEKENAHA